MTEPDFDPESLDLANMREITDGDRELERTLYMTFLSSGESCLEALTRLCVDGEQKEWKEHSHSLKGEAANLGAKKLAGFCQEAQMAYTASREIKLKLLEQIEQEWKVVRSYLEQLLAD
jgi:HPt (histidine-containing phosphotransfer) domain-containing protein